MHITVKNLLDIKNNIRFHLDDSGIKSNPKIIAVSKTFNMDNILPLVDHGHIDFGENKVQESIEKWTEIKKNYPKIKLHRGILIIIMQLDLLVCICIIDIILIIMHMQCYAYL